METRYLGVLVSFLLVLSLGLTFAQMRAPAQDCVPENCTLPNCRCFSTEIPQNLSKSETPQLVFISFDAAVSVDNFNFYREVLFSRKNPNGQPITVTFFVAHDYTNYSMVHELYRNGHEIGLHSISANTSQAYWQSLNATMWRRELVDQREQLSTFAKIPPAEIYGSRAQQLILGGDDHYDVLNQARIKYDCSRPAIDYRTVGLWPYSNDYKASQTCYPDPSTCPTGEHKGFWTVPIVPLTGDNGAACSLVDQCEPVPTTANETYAMLTRNFNNHYQGHRAPFGLYLRHGWVNGTGSGGDDEYIWERRAGFVRFLDDLANKSDVYIVSIYRGLQWVQDPTPLAQIDNFPPFNVNVRNSQCRQAFSCEYRAGQTPFKPPLSQERVFSSCITCPTAYPWVGNHLGRNPYT